MSHSSWEEIKAQRVDDQEAQVGYEQARRAYEVGREVRRQREAAGLTQRQLADRAGMTQSVIARLEAGGAEPTLATLARVARALGLELTIGFQRVAQPTRQRGRRASWRGDQPLSRFRAAGVYVREAVPRPVNPFTSQNAIVMASAVRLLPSGSAWCFVSRTSSTAAFIAKLG